MKKKYVISIMFVSLITGISVQALGVHYQSYVISPNYKSKFTETQYNYTVAAFDKVANESSLNSIITFKISSY